ncbi:Beta-scruin [Araneus ventricosus]|uniref:Beta-scruin n=1 Tax=Araneus ventricosus TaxID=182803 RepID=A0A4Y2DT01_ARAVE|nr:Beta-scruin [Araneus ventricosus]
MITQKCQLQRPLNKLPVTLGTIVKIDNAGNSSSPSDSGEEIRLTSDIKKDLKAYSRLPSQFDPNLGLVPYLPPLEASYEARMNQEWNVAPYFLEILSQSSCCDLNGCILLLGGLNPFKPDDFVLSSSIFEFHESSQTWRYYGSMLEPRCYHAACFVDSFLYVTGGYSALRRRDGEMLAIPSTDRLDIRTTLWKRCSDMKIARASHAIVALEKRLYVFGGRNSFGSIIASVEMYDTETDLWIEITLLPRPSMGLSATCVSNQVWILGGIAEDEEKSFISDVFTFTPSNKSWLVQTPLPGPHAFTSCISSGRTIWVVGGSHSSEEALVSCPCIWSLKLRSGQAKWKMVASLSAPAHSSCTVLCGKELYVFGGIRSEERKVTDTVEIFNTETGILRKGVSLPAAITGSSAIFLDKTASNIKAKKIVKSPISRNGEFAPKLDLHQTKLIQNQISSSAEPAHEQHKEKFHSKLKHVCETKTRFSENILSSMMQKENTTNQRHDDFKEESSVPYSDVHESDVSKSSQDKSSEVHATYSSEQPEPSWTTKARIHLNDCSFDSENKGADTKPYLRRRAMNRSSSTDKSSDDYTQMRAELYRRHFQVKQTCTKDREHLKNLSDFRRNLHVTTLKVPIDGNEERRKYRLNNLQPMRTEMILESRKWNTKEICFPDSNSGSIREGHHFKLYSPPPKWKMR